MAFLSGVVLPTLWKELPGLWVVYTLILTSLILGLCSYKATPKKAINAYKKSENSFFKGFISRYLVGLQIGIAFILGMAWCIYRASELIAPLPEHYCNQPISVTGTIISVPEIKVGRIQFEYLIDSIYKIPCKPMRILMSEYNYKNQIFLPVKIGERWQLAVRLKQPRGFWNPGSFDYEAWLLQRGIKATGIVVSNSNPKKALKQETLASKKLVSQFSIQQPLFIIHAFIYHCRSIIHQNLHDAIQEKSIIGLLSALVIGARDEISDKQWEVMRATGTNHLFAISGLHVGFTGGLLYAVVNYLWRHIGYLSLYKPAQQAAYIAAWIGACIYSLLSGFALPVQRALLMFTVFIITLLKQRVLPVWRGWSIALLITLLINPLVVISESFWLSFGAVAIIFYGLGARLHFKESSSRWHQLWQSWGKTQAIVTIGLIPLTILFFQQVAFLGFFANLVAIPWVGFLVLPVSLIGVLLQLIFPTVGDVLLLCGVKSLEVLWQGLSYIASLPVAQGFSQINSLWIMLSTTLGVLLYLSPSRFPGRYYLGSVCLLPFLLWKPLVPKYGEIWLTVLDVGQGLSAIIQTQKHVLIYDTGPRLGMSLDTGNAVVIPYLKTLNIKHIDKLIISHGDNDHSGGAESILKSTCVKSVLASQPERMKANVALLCHKNQSWEWDGVRFKILHPPQTHNFKGNDASCVLSINNDNYNLLLPGDIHRKAENFLIKTHLDLKTTILIAPHHGSKTSSSIPFIRATRPYYVILPVGYRNRFKFPHAKVVENYKRYDSILYSTAEQGAITLKLGAHSKEIGMNSYYLSQRRFWHVAR